MAKKVKTEPSIVALIDKLAGYVSLAKEEAVKFDSGNNAAGARARKALMNVRTLAQFIRATVSDVKNARKAG